MRRIALSGRPTARIATTALSAGMEFRPGLLLRAMPTMGDFAAVRRALWVTRLGGWFGTDDAQRAEASSASTADKAWR